MPLRRRFMIRFAPLSILLIAVITRAGTGGFQPVSPEELKMTSEPNAPGAPAIILYREVNRNDYGRTAHGGLSIAGNESATNNDRFEDDYFRIKILTEEGRKYANVEIPFRKEIEDVSAVRARTIRPDGSIVNFEGQIFEKNIVKTKGLEYVAKAFAIPDVQVGSIIEYYYTVTFKEGFIAFSSWILNNELFTKDAKFTLRPFQNDYAPMSFRWTERLPPGTPSPKQGADGIIRMEATNIAAFQTEDYMPPPTELRARVDFIYSSDPFETEPAKFWKKVGKKRNSDLENFVGKRAAIEQAASQIVSPTDAPEVKLQKLYARVQQLRNTSFEVQKSQQEQKRENRKAEENVEDIWKQASGTGRQLNWLYLALARAAGFEAYGVWIADRRNYFFQQQSMESGQLDRNIVLVKSNGKDLYFAPGEAFTPFGLLPWEETGVPGLRLDKDGGTWVQTPLPEASVSRIERKADLKLSADGNLEGKLTVTFTGLEALRRRVDERNHDNTDHKKSLEDLVKESIPMGSEIELTKQPDWTSSELPLIAEFSVKVPGWASMAGKRAVFPVGIFSATEKHVFVYTTRVHPVYFEFLSQNLDDTTIEIPSGWQVTALPKAQNQDLHVVGYALTAENKQNTIHLTRKLDINILTLDTKYYGPLRSFFQIVKAGDELQVALQPGAAVAAN